METALRFQKNLTDYDRTGSTLPSPTSTWSTAADHLTPFVAVSAVLCVVTFMAAFVMPMQASLLFPAAVLLLVATVQFVIAWAAPVHPVRALEGRPLQGQAGMGRICPLPLRHGHDPEVSA